MLSLGCLCWNDKKTYVRNETDSLASIQRILASQKNVVEIFEKYIALQIFQINISHPLYLQKKKNISTTSLTTTFPSTPFIRQPKLPLIYEKELLHVRVTKNKRLGQETTPGPLKSRVSLLL